MKEREKRERGKPKKWRATFPYDTTKAKPRSGDGKTNLNEENAAQVGGGRGGRHGRDAILDELGEGLNVRRLEDAEVEHLG